MAKSLTAKQLPKMMQDGKLPSSMFVYDHSNDAVSHPAERFTINPDMLASADHEVKALFASPLSNWICPATRNTRRRKYWSIEGKDRVVSEGDSWFLYPGREGSIGLEDIIDHLLYGHNIPVHSNGCYGDTVADMVRMADDRNEGYRTPLLFEQPKAFLFSGGGNDILKARDEGGIHTGNLYWHLRNHAPGMSAADYIKPSLFVLIDDVMDDISFIFSEVSRCASVIKIVTHGYGYAVPGAGSGTDLWLADPMDRRGIPSKPKLRRAIVRILIDYFNEELKALETVHRKLKYVDFRDDFKAVKWWHDPIHLTNAGYKIAAKKILAQL